MPGGDRHEPGSRDNEEVPSHPSCCKPPPGSPEPHGRLPGNYDLRSRSPRGAEINNRGALLPAGMIKLLIRSSNYSALQIPPALTHP